MLNRDTPSGQHESVRSRRAHYQFLDRGHPDDYRYEEIQALVRAIRARENRLVLGLSGMGMSNLLRFLVARDDLFDDRQVTFAYLNCDALDDCLDLEMFFETIAEQLQEQGLGDQPKMGERGYEWLRRLVTWVGGDPLRRVVIVVDRADNILMVVDKIFYRKLKALTDLNKRVCYIFAVSPLISEAIDPDNLLFAGRRLAVGRLNERDCTGVILEEAWRLEMEFDSAAQERLERLTGGHPGLLRAVTSAVVVERLDLSDTEEAVLVERLLARDDVKYRCQKIWNELDAAKRAALQFLVSDQPDLVAANTLTWLRVFGLIEERAGEYRLFSPIFQRFVEEVSLPQSEPITLDPIRIVGASTILKDGQEIIVAGKVFKGSQEIHVAPLELRLIACLKRKRKIYSKDNIAAYVYYEYEGKGKWDVETAIQNLVRQVRKRLGDHRYIKSHWGLGYEFRG